MTGHGDMATGRQDEMATPQGGEVKTTRKREKYPTIRPIHDPLPLPPSTSCQIPTRPELELGWPWWKKKKGKKGKKRGAGHKDARLVFLLLLINKYLLVLTAALPMRIRIINALFALTRAPCFASFPESMG